MMDVICIGNKNLKEYGVFFDGSKIFSTPKKDITFVSIPGRSGDIIINNKRYDNQQLTIPCFIREDFNKNFPELMNYLYSFDEYVKIELSTLPDVYFMGQLVDAVAPQTGVWNHSGTFNLVFNIMPQKWLKYGDEEITLQANEKIELLSKYKHPPVPLIITPGSSGNSFMINDNNYTIGNPAGAELYVDFLKRDAYEVTSDGRWLSYYNALILPEMRMEIELTAENDGWKYTVQAGSRGLRIKPRWYRL